MFNAAKAVQRIALQYTREQCDSDEIIRLAAERAVEIIREAARHISSAFRQEHPEIPWERIVAQRHVLAHEYDVIDPEQMWTLISDRVGRLITSLEPLLPPLPPEVE